jgi:hypothetical protein
MKFRITRLRMWLASMAAWIVLSLFLSPISGLASAQPSEIPGAQLGFSAALHLASAQVAEPPRVWFSDQSFRESPAFIGVIERYIPLYPDPKPLRIWFVDQSLRVPSVSISPRGRRLASRPDSKLFWISFFGQSFHKPSLSIQPRDSSFIAQTIDCLEKGLSLGGCGQ